MSIKLKIIIFSLLSCYHTLAVAKSTYYKCNTSNGVIFSQIPCSSNAKAHEVRPLNSTTKPLTKDYEKELTQFQLDQKKHNLKLQIRATKHELIMLKRDRSAKTLEQEQRLERMMDDQERKALKKEVARNVKKIEANYKVRIKQTEKTLLNYEKALRKFN